MARLQTNTRIPFRVSPMLATLVPRPFHKPNWVYEQKYDGIRILAYKEGERDWTSLKALWVSKPKPIARLDCLICTRDIKAPRYTNAQAPCSKWLQQPGPGYLV